MAKAKFELGELVKSKAGSVKMVVDAIDALITSITHW